MSASDEEATGAPLFNQVYDHLRRIAAARLRDERAGHTLQPTALVHEAWLRISTGRSGQPLNRADFCRAAVVAMRNILIDHARKRGAAKRDGGRKMTLDDVADLAIDEKIDAAIALDDQILRLAGVDERAAEVVRLRFFAGLGFDEIAEVLGISPRTAKDDWAAAKAWLARELRADKPSA